MNNNLPQVFHCVGCGQDFIGNHYCSGPFTSTGVLPTDEIAESPSPIVTHYDRIMQDMTVEAIAVRRIAKYAGRYRSSNGKQYKMLCDALAAEIAWLNCKEDV
jgi:hypothetical protein